MPKIVLIHGAWLGPSCWDLFKNHYEARGFEVIAPAWPYDEGTPAVLRANPRPELAQITIGQIVDHYEAIVRSLDEPPILIGHSFGGLFVQMLLDRGLGRVGVAIDPAPPRGVPPSLSALWGALPVFLAWRGWSRVLQMTEPQFAWAFVHTLPAAEQRRLYSAHAVPTPGRIYFQAAIGAQIAVDFAKADRAPLLLVAGERDRTVARQTVEKTFAKYRKSSARTELLHMPGRPHLLIATPGWEEVADKVLDWALSTTGAQSTSTPGGVKWELQDVG